MSLYSIRLCAIDAGEDLSGGGPLAQIRPGSCDLRLATTHCASFSRLQQALYSAHQSARFASGDRILGGFVSGTTYRSTAAKGACRNIRGAPESGLPAAAGYRVHALCGNRKSACCSVAPATPVTRHRAQSATCELLASQRVPDTHLPIPGRRLTARAKRPRPPWPPALRCHASACRNWREIASSHLTPSPWT